MAFSHSPKIATDGLVFYYDTGNGKSYKGEPTTNLALNPTFNSTTNWYYTTNGGGSFSTANNVGKITAGTAGSYTYLYQTVSTTVASNESLTWSVEFKNNIVGDFAIRIVLFLNGVVKTQPATYFSLDGTGGTVKKSVTTSHVDGANSIRIDVMQGSYYSGINTDTNIEFFNAQLERKSHATQFVNGTRSVTEGLLDLTKNETLNLSTAGFDSDANLTFDGTNDHIVLPSSIRSIFSSGPNCVELVLYKSSADQFNMVPFDVDITRWNLNYNMYVANQWSFDFYDGTEHYIAAGNYDDNYVHFVLQQLADGTMEIYANGELKGSEAAGSIAPNGNSARIGSRTNGSYYFKGELPLVKIYSRALTADEVAQNYNAIKNRFGI